MKNLKFAYKILKMEIRTGRMISANISAKNLSERGFDGCLRNDTNRLEYFLDKWRFPIIGPIFVFDSLRAARDAYDDYSCNCEFKSIIVKGVAEDLIKNKKWNDDFFVPTRLKSSTRYCKAFLPLQIIQ